MRSGGCEPAKSFLLDGDTALWVIDTPARLATGVAPETWLDRPCDNPDCPHVQEPLPSVVLDQPCSEWAGATYPAGYGRTTDGRRAHRVAWEEANGPIPDGMVVMHKCDNPICVEVAHLEVGTNADNTADMIAKGRQRTGRHRGEVNPTNQLSESDVLSIFHSPKSYKALAAEYGVGKTTIAHIKRSETWGWLTNPCDCDGTGRHTFDIEYSCFQQHRR